MFTECCSKWYFCSYCHDAVESGFINGGHEVERRNITKMKCCHCGHEQPPNGICTNPKCNKQIAAYFCVHCKFWDNDPTHSLFHCAKCGVCRSGDRNQYKHCDQCGVCLDKVECPQSVIVSRRVTECFSEIVVSALSLNVNLQCFYGNNPCTFWLSPFIAQLPSLSLNVH